MGALTQGFQLSPVQAGRFNVATMPALQGFNPASFTPDLVSPLLNGFKMGQSFAAPLADALDYINPDAKEARDTEKALKDAQIQKMLSENSLSPLKNAVEMKLLQEQAAELGLSPQQRAVNQGALKDLSMGATEKKSRDLANQTAEENLAAAKQKHADYLAGLAADKTLTDTERKAKEIKANLDLQDFTQALSEQNPKWQPNENDVRHNSSELKGTGAKGVIDMTDGSGNVMTELSVGVNIDGKNVEIPAIVPDLNSDEMEYLKAGGDPRTSQSIMKKAIDSATARMANGQSPFFANSETPKAPLAGLDITPNREVPSPLKAPAAPSNGFVYGQAPSKTLRGARVPGTMTRKEVANPDYDKYEREMGLRDDAAKKGFTDYQTAPLSDVTKFLQGGDKAAKMTDSKVAFMENASELSKQLDEFDNVVKKYGNYEHWDEKASAELGQLPYKTSILYAKLVDPATSAREGEVEAGKKYLIPVTGFNGSGLSSVIPSYTRNKVTLAAIANQKEELARRVQDYAATTGLVPKGLSESIVQMIDPNKLGDAKAEFQKLYSSGNESKDKGKVDFTPMNTDQRKNYMDSLAEGSKITVKGVEYTKKNGKFVSK